MRVSFRSALSALAIGVTGLSAFVLAAPAQAQFRQEVRNDPAACRGPGPAIRINVSAIESARGTIRVQLYRGIEADWLESGRWLKRIEVPAQQGNMSFCMSVPQAGTYGVAVRHDVNNNDSTDISTDGGAMSNNPSLNIFNLGKPSYRRTRFEVGNEVVTINIGMRYM